MYQGKIFKFDLIVSLKWGKENLPISIDINEDATVFKAQIYALTAIPSDKQKIFLKGVNPFWIPLI